MSVDELCSGYLVLLHAGERGKDKAVSPGKGLRDIEFDEGKRNLPW